MRWLLMIALVLCGVALADGQVVNVFDTKITAIECVESLNVKNALSALVIGIIVAIVAAALGWLFDGANELSVIGGGLVGLFVGVSAGALLFDTVDHNCRVLLVDGTQENYMAQDVFTNPPEVGKWVKLVYVGDFKYVIVPNQ